MQYIVTWEDDGSETMVDGPFTTEDAAWDWKELILDHLPFAIVEVHEREGVGVLDEATDEMVEFILEIAKE